MANTLADSARISLLLRRAGFAARPVELDYYTKLGWDGTLNELLHPELVQEDLDGLLGSLQGGLLDLQNIEDVQTWWLYRMVQTRRPLLEKLTLFWHGHFAVANYKVNNPLLMHQHIQMLRTGALGTFDDMLLAVSKDPAMLIWLDGGSNHRNAPNENYGRELLELFTLGIGNYSEDDVKAAARAFTGWNLRNGTDFFFDENQHDAGDKTFLGQSGNLDGTDILKNIVSQPATARRIVGKLFAFFAYPNAEPEVLAPLVDTYMNEGHDIRKVTEAILRSDAFVSDRSRFEHIKSPVEYVVGSVRMMDATVRERDLVGVLRLLGQEILNPPNVAGWPGGPSWINPSTLLTRWNFAARLTSARGQTGDSGELKAESVLGMKTPDLSNPDGALQSILATLGGMELSPEAEQALVGYVKLPLDYPPGFSGQPNPSQQQAAADARLRGLMLLSLATTDYQVG
ncbi:MAG: DUF1800 domain-containing protein [Chloroflexi bacterium]|nr:DUF1800 domain-containing protein [Chloroflexota bacterium]